MSLMKRISSIVAVALFALSASAAANAEQVIFNGSGSSALFLGLGRAAYNVAAEPAHGSGACIWTQANGAPGTAFTMTDSSAQGGGLQETGQEWVVWSTGTGVGASCTTPVGPNIVVLAYQQTDSVIGDRCLFNGCTITTGATTSLGTANLVFPAGSGTGVTETPNIPTNILNKLGGLGSTPALITAAGTDIRPEDALFATQRAITPCGATTDGTTSIAPYLGLGYHNGDSILSFYNPADFYHVVTFSIPLGGANVTPVGASAILVAVNHTAGGSNGFGDPNITNMNSGVLANFLDGTYSQTKSAVTNLSDTNASAPVTVLLREPLSGTYNTMEYNVPNTVSLQTSQDVGVNQITAQRNCSGTVPAQFTLNVPTAGVGGAPGARNRVIGTGESTNVLFGNGFTAPADGLTYAFWSGPNFAHATGNSKYLTIDGVDPLGTGTAGVLGGIPTTGNGLLPSVTLNNIQNGSYPIWSMQRIVDLGGASGVADLAAKAQLFPTFGAGSVDPDYIPVNAMSGPNVAKNLGVVRSHFNPPGQAVTAANGTGTTLEAGGDVGGVVFTIFGDMNYNTDFSVQTGETGRRR